MADSEFRPGQRWVSNTESELGLGLVESNELRRVTLNFPVIGEHRTYATDNAPLTRVIFTVGDEIRDRHGVTLTVTERAQKNGCFIYLGVDQDGKNSAIHEIDLDSTIQFSKPQDRLFAGQIDSNRNFDLRADTLEYQHEHQTSPAYGLNGPRVQLLAHQLYITNQAALQPAPRLLLADEVGLGKTIEAGLIMHQQLINQRASRVLILVPESLLHQWLVEMLRRFNLSFTLLDEQRCEELETEGHGNPFSSAQLILTRVELLADDPVREQQALEAGFDLMIVDEAHRLSLDLGEGANEASEHSAYKSVQALANATPGVLLLTATPEQFGAAGHWARLRLLDPQRYPDLSSYQAEQASYHSVNAVIEALLELAPNAPLPAELQSRIETILGEPCGVTDTLGTEADVEDGPGLSTSPAAPSLPEPVVQTDFNKQLLNRLLDRHGTGRAMFRNTRDGIKGFPKRRLHAYALEAPEAYQSTLPDTPLDSLLRPERLLGERWLTLDTRVAWLAGWLQSRAASKVLVICKQAETARSLEEYLRTRQGIRSALFNEQLTLIARDRAAAYFAEAEDGAQVLVCSEIGSEGRNFQFAHDLVLFDLPLDPDLLEQRIGRLDRIGQRETVRIHVPYYSNSAQSVLLRVYHEGMNAFERTCTAGAQIVNALQEQLLPLLQQSTNHAAIETLVEETRAQTERALAVLKSGRDRLLELNSCREPDATQLVYTLAAAERRTELVDFMERMFDCLGVNQQAHGYSVVLHPGDHMLCQGLPSLGEDGVTATYSREQALSREDMLFLTWEHPLVTAAMDVIQSTGIGNTALCTLKDSGLTPGTLLVETLFTPHCPAARNLQAYRYLPLACMRVLIDSNGVDQSVRLNREKMLQLMQNVPQKTAREIVKRARKPIATLIERARALAMDQQSTVIDSARAGARAHYEEELSRAKALAKSNPTQIGAHIERLENDRDNLLGALSGTQLRLDAIRVALAT